MGCFTIVNNTFWSSRSTRNEKLLSTPIALPPHPASPAQSAAKFLWTNMAPNRGLQARSSLGRFDVEPRMTKFGDSYALWSGCPNKKSLQEPARQWSLEDIPPSSSFLPPPPPVHVACQGDSDLLRREGWKKEDTLLRYVCQVTGTTSEYGRIRSNTSKNTPAHVAWRKTTGRQKKRNKIVTLGGQEEDARETQGRLEGRQQAHTREIDGAEETRRQETQLGHSANSPAKSQTRKPDDRSASHQANQKSRQ